MRLPKMKQDKDPLEKHGEGVSVFRQKLAEEELPASNRKSTRTKNALRESALALMAEKGYQNATIREICENAHVSPATFYTYYASKLDLLENLYRSGDQYFTEEVAPRMADENPIDQIRMFAAEYALLNVETGLDFMRILYNPEDKWLAINRPMQEVLRSAVDQARAKGLIREDIDVDDVMFSVFVNLRGITYTWTFMDAGFDLVDATVRQIDLLLEGLLV